MLYKRVIPVLLISGDELVKTIKFDKKTYVGDPVNAIKIFNDKEVDEIIVLDISASRYDREPNYQLIEELAGECFMPVTYGGGVSNLNQAKTIFSLGVEKISVQTAFYEDINFVCELTQFFGSQSIVASVDVKHGLFGKKTNLYSYSTKSISRIDWLNWLELLVNNGVGEILLNSIDKDGTLSGPDLSLIQQATGKINVPLVYLGGISSLADIRNSLRAGASGVAAGSFFVFYGPHKAVLLTYPKYDQLIELFSNLT